MQNYEKPEVILMTECSEGVYLASGGQTGEDPTAGECDSRYMKGAWKKPDYSNSIRRKSIRNYRISAKITVKIF